MTTGRAMATETKNAKQAWADLLSLGPGADYGDLVASYQRRHAKTGQKPPTLSLLTIKGWAADFGWQARLEAIADDHRREAETDLAAGYALAVRRLVRILNAPGFVPPETVIKAITALKPTAPRGPVEINVTHAGRVNHDHRDLSLFTDDEIEHLADVQQRRRDRELAG